MLFDLFATAVLLILFYGIRERTFAEHHFAAVEYVTTVGLLSYFFLIGGGTITVYVISWFAGQIIGRLVAKHFVNAAPPAAP